MTVSKETLELAIAEIVRVLPKKTGSKNARKIAKKKLNQALHDIREFYDCDSAVLENCQDITSTLRRNHRSLSILILTSYPGTTADTAQQLLNQLLNSDSV